MGVSLDIAAVLALESLLSAIRSVAFIVPNSIGVQEGAYVMLGTTLGLSPDFALALSLLKRGRDLVVGIPAAGDLANFREPPAVASPARLNGAGTSHRRTCPR